MRSLVSLDRAVGAVRSSVGQGLAGDLWPPSRRGVAPLVLLGSLLGVLIFSSQALAALAPSVSFERTAKVVLTTAAVEALINPQGADTTYRVEYGIDSSYGSAAPVPDADIGSGEEGIEVSQTLKGLEPGTTYHYRVVAKNVEGTTAGPDQVLATYSSPAISQSETCTNASFRLGGLSAGLPDCRAYELVSPIDKNGGDIVGDGHTNLSSASGDGLVIAARAGIADTEGSGGVAVSQYIATRGTSSWSTHGTTRTPALSAAQIFVGDTFNLAFSADLSASVITGYDLPGTTGGVPNGVNLYYENTSTNQLETITTPLGTEVIPPFGSLGLAPRGYSADLSVVTLQTTSNLLPETIEGNENKKLYAWSHGRLTLAGVLPNGSIPAGGSEAPVVNGEITQNMGTVSSDGSRILFVSPADGSSPQQLYMREGGASTVWVSQSEASTPDPEPLEVKYQGVSPDGHEVLFSTSDRLLDSDPGGGGLALYRYTDSSKPETESNLTFITRIRGSRASLVPAMSEDGNRIYFLSEEMAGLPTGKGGSFQLYLWDQGVVHWVAGPFGERELEPNNEEVWASADGTRLALESQEGLTAQTLERVKAIYLYDEAGDTFRCASCALSGAPPTSGIEMEPTATHAAASVGLPFPERHVLSNDGRYVFFSTSEALLPQDTNGLPDAYEYDADSGVISLLSPGTGNNGSWFIEASPSGRDAFIVTREELNGWDIDSLADIYDARADGGFPEPQPAPVACLGDACQGVPSPTPSFTTASGFSGLGNVLEKPATPVKKKAKAKGKRSKPKRRHSNVKRHLKKRGASPKKSIKQSSSHVGR